MPSTLNPDCFEKSWTPLQLRVPRGDRQLLAQPSLDDTLTAIDDNRSLFELHSGNVKLQGRTLSQLRSWARQEILQLARDYTANTLGLSIPETTSEADQKLFVTGHQPALFHIGVWVKNIALAKLARAGHGTGLNLIIDNDTLTSREVRVPVCSGSPGGGGAPRSGSPRSLPNQESPETSLREIPCHPEITSLPFDATAPVMPWEEARVQDLSIFARFAEEIEQHLHPWGIEPLVSSIWPDVVQQAQAGRPLAESLTLGRASVERRWGLGNLELPLSQVCESEPFLWFTSHLLAHLPKFRDIHNQVLAEYRKVNRIRSKTHPVPELQQKGDWLEAPFWIWKRGAETRGRVFAKQVEKELILADDKFQEFARLPLSPMQDACCAVKELKALPAKGIRLRTRALTTTLFARLCLSDLFIHGIGGAKYDEMTDRMICRFYGLKAPKFLVLSGTLHLPLAQPFDVQPEDETRITQLLRDLDYNPARYLPENSSPEVQQLLQRQAELVREQQAWDAHPPRPRADRRQQSRLNSARYRELQRIHRSLSEHLTEQRERFQQELSLIRSQLAANKILKDREWSWCLYPEAKLQSFLESLGGELEE